MTHLHPRPSRRAFTLIELLVVVSIIVVLMAVLLPSLSQARRIAKTVKCATQVRQIGLAMLTYAQEYDTYIIGNAHSTGAFLLTPSPPPNPAYSDTYCPSISQVWDWTAPIAKQMGINFDANGYTANRQARFRQLAKQPAFLCPENDILSPTFSGAPFTVPTTSMISYNTASLFQYEYGSGPVYLAQNYIPTGSYRPKTSLVGNPSTKIFLADGARWSNDGTTTPDVNLGYLGSGSSPGGHYAEYGPWSAFSRAYLRPNGPSFAMRHGSRLPGAALNAYRFNAVFFDGHAETLDGLRGANPALWAPSGASIPSSEINQEASAAYLHGSTFEVP